MNLTQDQFFMMYGRALMQNAMLEQRIALLEAELAKLNGREGEPAPRLQDCLVDEDCAEEG